MSDTSAEHKKRPPPIHIPPLPLPRPVPGPNAFGNTLQSSELQTKGTNQYQQQREAKFMSSPTQRAHSTTSTPLTSPLDGSHLPHSGSQTGRTRTSAAMSTLSNLIDQARVSPRKSDHGSVQSRGGSTSRSRHSERSHQSASSGQVRLEAMYQDAKTTRAEIELRTEKKLFKMTGQIPPTPIADVVRGEVVYIRTEDLRPQCRAASGEHQPNHDESTKRDDVSKSPKKKLFGVSLPTFTRTLAVVPTPPMPSKAAQVLGTEARKPRRIEARPIKPADPTKTPTKVPRSNTAKSLPSKLYEANYARCHQSFSRRNRAASRKSPCREGVQSCATHLHVSSPSDTVAPPTPPAKDTPPDGKPVVRAPSPLRRTLQSKDLRKDYDEFVDRGMKLQFPTFALSPSPPKTAIVDNAGASPTKFRPYTAKDYVKLIEGEPLEWPGSQVDDAKQEGNHSAPLEGENRELLQPRTDRWSEEKDYAARIARRLTPMPLPPRFYSPSNRTPGLFVEGESPSKNTNPKRLLFAPPAKASDLHLCEDCNIESNNGSIEMVFQGSINDIDPESPTARLVHNGDRAPTTPCERDETEDAAYVTNEFQFGEQPTPRWNKNADLLQPDPSSSKLTDMLNGVSPYRDLGGNFEPNCPSAVPSPLHKMMDPQAAPQLMLPGPNSALLPMWPPRTPKSMDDHFYMTNEHLDVVGKTTWDLLEISKRHQVTALNTKHDQLVEILTKHVDGIKSQVDSVSDKADEISRHNHNNSLNLDELLRFIKSEVIDMLTAQNKKATGMEAHIKELQKTVQGLQKMIEQRLSEPKTRQSLSAAGPAHTPFPPTAHRAQPSLVSYYGNVTEPGRDDHSSMTRTQDNRNMTPAHDTHNDPCLVYGNNYSQQWGPRSGYHARSSKEDRSPHYNYSNGGQPGNGYMGGYP